MVLTNEEILNNSGTNQLEDVMEAHIQAAENELNDEMDISLHGNGTRFGGKELGGLQLAILTAVSSGSYGGIARSNAVWQTSAFDANSYDTTIGTQVTATTVRPFLNKIVTKRSRGKQSADLMLMSAEHYAAYDAATVSIQRVNDETKLGKLGFQTLKYFGAGRSLEIVQDGGIGSNMPAEHHVRHRHRQPVDAVPPRAELRQDRPLDDADQPGRRRPVHRVHGRAHHDQSAVPVEVLRQQPGRLSLTL